MAESTIHTLSTKPLRCSSVATNNLIYIEFLGSHLGLCLLFFLSKCCKFNLICNDFMTPAMRSILPTHRT